MKEFNIVGHPNPINFPVQGCKISRENSKTNNTMAPETFPKNQTPPTTASNHVAIIFGVTGLVGKELAKRLVSKQNWKVYGIARRPEPLLMEVCTSNQFHFISCDLLDPNETQQKVSLLEDVTHIFWVTWASHFPLDSPECCNQNRVMMVNVLNALLPKATSLKHVSLQTGMKHYVSLTCPSVGQVVRYFDEDCPRVVVDSGCNNFYYDLEDLLMERLEGINVSFSVHRPGLLTGSSRKTLYNFMGSLCVYGTICRYMNLPFVFGGTKERWEEVSIDGSDARLVAEQHIWAASDDRICNFEAFNCINGVPFTWKEIWPSIGKKFGVKVPQEMFQQVTNKPVSKFCHLFQNIDESKK